jgi:thiamine biosynthesis protein ThiI
VRYGELGLKSPSVRRRFENALLDDIRKRHAIAKVPCVISTMRGRIFVDSDDWRKSCEVLSHTFGVVSFSPVTRTASDLAKLTQDTLEFARPLMFDGASFAIRSRRSGNHPYTSQTLAETLGAAILNDSLAKHIRVSLDEPDVEISVEVRDTLAFLFSSALAGPGGMPLGTQGRMLCVIEDERGVASTWLMMKRGCSAIVAAKDAQPLTVFDKWYPNLKSVDIQGDVMKQAEETECIGVSLSWDLESIEKGALKGDLPVFYPLVGMNDEEVSALLARIRA